MKFRISYWSIRVRNFCQILLKLAREPPYIHTNNFNISIFDILKIDQVLLILRETKVEDGNFCYFLQQISPLNRHFSKYQKFSIEFVTLYDGRVLRCKLQIKSDKNRDPWYILLKISLISEFSYLFTRDHHNGKLQNATASERGRILTFCRKPLFPLMEIFQISSTWFFFTLGRGGRFEVPKCAQTCSNLRENFHWFVCPLVYLSLNI